MYSHNSFSAHLSLGNCLHKCMEQCSCNTHAVSCCFDQNIVSYERNVMKEIKAPEMRLCGLLVQLAQYISSVCEYNEEFSNTSCKILVYNNYLHLL